MAGLRLSTPSWEISNTVRDVSVFLRALSKLVPDDAILFLEGGGHPPVLRTLLEENRFRPALRPALGTIWPRQPTFALPTTEAFLNKLAEVAEFCAVPEVCTHLHVYRGEEVLLEGYDAFTQPFYVSRLVSEEHLREFCAELGASWNPTSTPNSSIGKGIQRK